MQIPIMQEVTCGKSVLAYGYEAVARGALEADVKVVSGFPGTPSTGALEALASVADARGIHVEWATNERVALETAWGAAMNGQRSLCTMNHLGTNVVMDCLKYCVNYGVTGGMVVFAGDDVGANTSAIEADSRVLASAADLPILTPATPEEARIMTKYAFTLSEELGCPVMVRSVCQLMMARTAVPVGEIEKVPHTSAFAPNPRRVVMFEPGVMAAVTIHRFMHENLKKAAELLAAQGFDRANSAAGAKLGVICGGVSLSIVKQAIHRCGANVSLLKLGVANPVNEKIIADFAGSVDELVVIEEGEAYLELRVQAILGRAGIHKPLHGRLSGEIPFGGELFVLDCENILRGLCGMEKREADAAAPFLAERNLTLCAGCGHLGVFYALRKTMEQVNGGKYVAFADAGCAFMGILTPARSLNSATNMGGCLSFAGGVAQSGSSDPVFALCGDGGFLHGGVSAMANAVFNHADMVVILLDNSTLGNTGLQPTGCTGHTVTGHGAPQTDLAGVCRSMGAPFVTEADPMDVSAVSAAIRAALAAPKPAVIVAKAPCALNRRKDEKRAGKPAMTAAVLSDACKKCGKCMELYCAAITERGVIRSDLCSACGMCLGVCPEQAIRLVEV